MEIGLIGGSLAESFLSPAQAVITRRTAAASVVVNERFTS